MNFRNLGPQLGQPVEQFHQALIGAEFESTLMPNAQWSPDWPIVVQWGVRGQGRLRAIRGSERLLVLEYGFVHRDQYVSAGWLVRRSPPGINGFLDFRAQPRPDRWAEMGVEMQPWGPRGDAILLCGQILGDASLNELDDYRIWVNETIEQIRRYSDRPLVWRPHPKERIKVRTSVERSRLPLEEDLNRAWAVVTFNSNTAVESTIAGVPTWTFSAGSMAHPVTRHSLDSLEKPFPEPDRTAWAHWLAATQWLPSEFDQAVSQLFADFGNRGGRIAQSDSTDRIAV